MAVNAQRIINIILSGDVNFNQAFAASANAASPGSVQRLNTVNGVNTFTLPTGTKAVTIIPPSTNTFTITLKGALGDSGVGLSKTEPTSLTFDTTVTEFTLATGGIIAGLILIWT